MKSPTDKVTTVGTKRTTLHSFLVYPLGMYEDKVIVNSPDQYQALWDAFQVSGMQLDNRYKKSNLPYDRTKAYFLDLGGTEYVVKKLSKLQLDTVYA